MHFNNKSFYIHIGFHKTASTSLQLLLNEFSKHQDAIRIINPIDFRHYWNKRHIQKQNIIELFNSVLDKHDTVFLSEENISGETFEIFKQERLYENLNNNLISLKRTLPEAEITLICFIRNMATFLPSIYAEALNWFPFQPFEKIYQGNIFQSWVPVIKDIAFSFPKAQIRVACYEDYKEVYEKILQPLKINEYGIYFDINRVTNKSCSYQAIKLHECLSKVLPPIIHGPAFRQIRRIDTFSKQKYMPFTENVILKMSKNYQNDKAVIENLPNVEFIKPHLM
jgi:hypothetical protein